jgi:hypothetical protein
LKEKKEIVAFHLNNNPFINSWLVKSVNNWNDLPVLTKKITPTERLSTGYSSKMSTSAKHRDLAEILSSLPGTNTLMLYFGLLPPTVMVGMELI